MFNSAMLCVALLWECSVNLQFRALFRRFIVLTVDEIIFQEWFSMSEAFLLLVVSVLFCFILPLENGSCKEQLSGPDFLSEYHAYIFCGWEYSLIFSRCECEGVPLLLENTLSL